MGREVNYLARLSLGKLSANNSEWHIYWSIEVLLLLVVVVCVELEENGMWKSATLACEREPTTTTTTTTRVAKSLLSEN